MERTPDGRFAKDNPGGPGNPHARHCARMLALLRTSISDEEMVAIIRVLVEKARGGDVSAAKLLMSYKLGKPAPAPNPDQIDRDEWEHYQKDAINLEQVQQVLGSLPSKVGNDIARTALPIVTHARKGDLAVQLVKNLPAASKPTKETTVAIKEARGDAPIPNDYSEHKGRTGKATIHDSRSTTNDAPPLPIGNSNRSLRADQPTIHDQRSTTNDAPPIANRKSQTKLKAKAKPKKLKPEWLRNVARKTEDTRPKGRGRARSGRA
jgi:hypothetical protein